MLVLVNYTNLILLMFQYYFECRHYVVSKILNFVGTTDRVASDRALSKISDIDSANVGGTKY